MIQVIFVGHDIPAKLLEYNGKFHMSIDQFKGITGRGRVYLDGHEEHRVGMFIDRKWDYTTTKKIHLHTNDPIPTDVIVSRGTLVTLNRHLKKAHFPIAYGVHPIDAPVIDREHDWVEIHVTHGKMFNIERDKDKLPKKRRITLKPSISRKSPTSANSPVFV